MLDRLFMGAAADDKLFVEDVFSTYLYTGNGTIQTITNGIDLDGKNGMVWIKNRNASSDPLHYLNFKDGSVISSNNSNNTSAKQVMTPYAAFNSNGFTVNALPGFLNNSGVNYAAWSFRKAPKFFDVVTFTKTAEVQNLPHGLGVVPGFAIFKRTNGTGDWYAVHRSRNGFLILNSTSGTIGPTVAGIGGPTAWLPATDTTFNPGSFLGVGEEGVAYLFAHDETADGVIQCGSFTTDGSGNATVNLGWEPQWILYKKTDEVADWAIHDTMRGFNLSGYNRLRANTSEAESSGSGKYLYPTATGFQVDAGWFGGTLPGTYIYIAIRRPMKTPTLGTSVFMPQATAGAINGTPSTLRYTAGFPVDMLWEGARAGDSDNAGVTDRLRGVPVLRTSQTIGESGETALRFSSMTGIWGTVSAGANANYCGWMFRRAPGFFDEVCYTGTGAANRSIPHNLGVTPELSITKARKSLSLGDADSNNWIVRHKDYENAVFLMNSNVAARAWSPSYWPPTTTWFGASSLNTGSPTNGQFWVNGSGEDYVAYLFASCPGVSKVGSYTGNGSSQTINCGFAAGARFVMIKRTDVAEHWHVFDTARGINAGDDPALRLSSDTAEFTSAAINPESSGFTVVQSASCNNNVSGGTYIYLAIA